MVTRNKPLAKKGRGRPRKPDAATSIVAVALTKDLLVLLDAWRAREGVKTRSTAIRWLVEQGLRKGGKP